MMARFFAPTFFVSSVFFVETLFPGGWRIAGLPREGKARRFAAFSCKPFRINRAIFVYQKMYKGNRETGRNIAEFFVSNSPSLRLVPTEVLDRQCNYTGFGFGFCGIHLDWDEILYEKILGVHQIRGDLGSDGGFWLRRWVLNAALDVVLRLIRNSYSSSSHLSCME